MFLLCIVLVAVVVVAAGLTHPEVEEVCEEEEGGVEESSAINQDSPYGNQDGT